MDVNSKKYKYKQKNKPIPPVPPKGHPPYNVNGEGGRPKKWTSECLDELADSLDAWLDAALETKKEFWWQDWCFEVGTIPEKMATFAREHPRFRKSYERAKSWQAHIVQKGALHKKFSEGFSKFFLINRYPDQWRDKASTDAAITPEALIHYKAVLEQMEKLQLQSSERKIEETNNNTESKS